MNKPDFTAALMNAWHLQPLGMRDDKRLQAVIDAAWAMRTVAPPAEKVLDEAVACAKMYHHSMNVRTAALRFAFVRPDTPTVARRKFLKELEQRIRDRVAAAIK